jgi:hypothetical protein
MTGYANIISLSDVLVGAPFHANSPRRTGSFFKHHFFTTQIMKKYLIIAALALIGTGNALYLSIPAYQYWNGADKTALQMMPCDLSDTLSCSGILQNPRAIIFSIGDFKVAFPMIALIVYPLLFKLAVA